MTSTSASENTRRPVRRRLRAAATGAVAGATGLIAGAAAPVPAGAIGTSAAVAPAAGSDKAAQPAMSCLSPDDGRIVRTANIIHNNGTDWGDVQLWYSPTCRSVMTKAITPNMQCTYGISLLFAYVYHQGNLTAGGGCTIGALPAISRTEWVNDAGIQQYGKADVWIGDSKVATGVTGAY